RLLRVHGQGPVARRLAAQLASAGRVVQRMDRSDWVGIEADGAQLRLTDGRPASLIASEGPRNLAVFDWPLSADTGTALAWAPAVQCSAAWAQTAPLWLRALGFNPQRVADVPGLVVARTVATLVNEAAEAVREGVCSAEATDLALVLGAGAPAGPFAWLSHWGAAAVLAVLAALDDADRGGRHRASALLRERAWTDVPVVRPLSVLPS
ncbi:MAG: 3-hydroxyacyl-CoA dehydrogenase family protein, partial [Leptothrix sp. (in: b-proteobacteria)]